MPSFDIVSEIDMQEVRNAVENATRDLGTRWDFRNVPASFELNEKDQSIKVATESDFQVQQLLDILREKLSKRSIDGAALEIQGIETSVAKKIVKLIKDSKLKVQAQIQGEEVRVTGKSRDDLQSVMALVRGGDLGQPFQFKNFRD